MISLLRLQLRNVTEIINKIHQHPIDGSQHTEQQEKVAGVWSKMAFPGVIGIIGGGGACFFAGRAIQNFQNENWKAGAGAVVACAFSALITCAAIVHSIQVFKN